LKLRHAALVTEIKLLQETKKALLAEDKKNTRLLALATTSMASAVGDGTYLKTGRQRNMEEAKVRMAAATTNIT